MTQDMQSTHSHSKSAILITAASGRIGRAMALYLAGQNYHIYLHYRSNKDGAEKTLNDIEALQGSATLLHADLNDYQQCESLLKNCQNTEYPLRHIINNASQFNEDDLLDFDESSFEQHMNVNLRAPLQLARGLYHQLPEGEHGSIINIIDSKVFALNPDYFSYSLSKIGLNGATEMMAQRLSPKIRVNGIAPGLTLISHTQSDQNFKLASHLNFNGAPLHVDDIAHTAHYLLTTPSINGVVIPVDGGQKMMNLSGDIVHIAEDILKRGLTD